MSDTGVAHAVSAVVILQTVIQILTHLPSLWTRAAQDGGHRCISTDPTARAPPLPGVSALHHRVWSVGRTFPPGQMRAGAFIQVGANAYSSWVQTPKPPAGAWVPQDVSAAVNAGTGTSDSCEVPGSLLPGECGHAVLPTPSLLVLCAVPFRAPLDTKQILLPQLSLTLRSLRTLRDVFHSRVPESWVHPGVGVPAGSWAVHSPSTHTYPSPHRVLSLNTSTVAGGIAATSCGSWGVSQLLETCCPRWETGGLQGHWLPIILQFGLN